MSPDLEPTADDLAAARSDLTDPHTSDPMLAVASYATAACNALGAILADRLGGEVGPLELRLAAATVRHLRAAGQVCRERLAELHAARLAELAGKEAAA